MFFQLDRLAIHLHCSDQQVARYFAQLLEEWPAETVTGSPSPTPQGEVAVRFELATQLPPRPPGKHLFSATNADLPDDVGQLAIYDSDQALWFHFAGSALVKLSGLEHQPVAGRIDGVVTAVALHYGRLEDVLLTCLAPFLRRQQLYLAHAFAAARDGRALLLVGPSGSGKTTTGLALVHHGWQYLANDVVMLKQRSEGVYALPMPGGFNVAPPTWSLLPWLKEKVALPAGRRPDTRRYLPARQVVAGWGEPARVAAVCFSQVQPGEPSRLVRESQALSLARLMENSLDRWDQASLAGHISLLQRLASQAAGYNLQLGQDLDQLPERLAGLIQQNRAG